jgi:hypothetical protein
MRAKADGEWTTVNGRSTGVGCTREKHALGTCHRLFGHDELGMKTKGYEVIYLARIVLLHGVDRERAECEVIKVEVLEGAPRGLLPFPNSVTG